jgi:WD40 repeat protein
MRVTRLTQLVVFSLALLFVVGQSEAQDGDSGTASSKHFFTLQRKEGVARGIAFSPDGRTLASTYSKKKQKGEESVAMVTIWDLASHTKIRELPHHAFDVAFSPDGSILASAGGPLEGASRTKGKMRTIIHLWNPDTGEKIGAIEDQWLFATSIAFSPDARFVVASGRDKSLLPVLGLWHFDTLEKKYFFPKSLEPVAFSPDGNLIACVYLDMAKIWNLQKTSTDLAAGEMALPAWKLNPGSLKRSKLMKDPQVLAVAFSPAGDYLATGSARGGKIFGIPITLWDLSTGEMVREFQGHTDSITDVVFSPNGKLIASSSEDHKVIIWDVDAGDKVATLEEHSATVNSVAFSADGKWLASAGDDSVNVWDVSALLRQ